MLDYQIARDLYDKIRMNADSCKDEMVNSFYHDFLQKACNYARIRTEWAFMDQNTRNSEDAGRTNVHNGFIDSLNIICRCFGIQNVDDILPNRKYVGDFACYIALFLALEQR